MPFTRIVGLQVDDSEMYSQYRAAMEPILKRFGGEFQFDFTIDKTLRNSGGKPINRLFVIAFPNRECKDNFFGDADYRQIRQRYFEPAVSAATIIAENEQP